MQLCAAGTALTPGVLVEIAIDDEFYSDLRISLVVFNPSNVPIDPPATLYLALNFPSDLRPQYSMSGVMMPDGRYRKKIVAVSSLLP